MRDGPEYLTERDLSVFIHVGESAPARGGTSCRRALPYTTLLATFHATQRNLDEIEVVLAHSEQSGTCLLQPPARQCLSPDQSRAPECPVGRDEREDPDTPRDRPIQLAASRHFQRAQRTQRAKDPGADQQASREGTRPPGQGEQSLNRMCERRFSAFEAGF